MKSLLEIRSNLLKLKRHTEKEIKEEERKNDNIVKAFLLQNNYRETRQSLKKSRGELKMEASREKRTQLKRMINGEE